MGLNLPDTDFSVDEEEEEKNAGEKSEEETAPAPTFLDDSRALKKDLQNYYTGPPAWRETRYGIFKAFGRLGNAFVTNDDFRNALLGSLAASTGLKAVAVSMAPLAIAATPYASTLYGASKAVETITDVFGPNAPSTPYGFLKRGYDFIQEYLENNDE